MLSIMLFSSFEQINILYLKISLKLVVHTISVLNRLSLLSNNHILSKTYLKLFSFFLLLNPSL